MRRGEARTRAHHTPHRFYQAAYGQASWKLDELLKGRKATMLNTIEFGWIRIANASAIKEPFDSFIGQDLICEWNFYQLASGEIVAVANE